MADALPNSTSISAAAHAYQLAMSQQASSSVPTPVLPPTNDISSPLPLGDIAMSEAPPIGAASPIPATAAANAPSPGPAPNRTGTPNGNPTSRAASQHPEPAPAIPVEAAPHGAPVRQYLNTKVTSVLLEGMKQLAKDQPRDPLRQLGEYLLQRSKELEG